MEYFYLRDRLSERSSGNATAIASIFCLIAATLCVCGRVYTKTSALRKVAEDDYAVFIALLLFIGQTISIIMASRNGLGQHWESLDRDQQASFLKSLYAAGLIIVPILVSVKASITLFIRGLGPMPVHSFIGIAFGIFLILWGVASEFAASFECNPPDTWNPFRNSCFNFLLFWNLVGTVNIATDLFLVGWPSMIIAKIHARLSRRIMIVVLFSTRLLVVASSVTQLVLANAMSGSPDLSFDLWPTLVCAQVMLATSIMTACFPYLVPFFASLESGMLRSDDLRRRGHEHGYGYGTRRSYGTRSKPSVSDHKIEEPYAAGPLVLRPLNVETKTVTHSGAGTPWSDGQSSSSRTPMIHYEQSWNIEVGPISKEVTSPEHPSGRV